MISSCSSIPTLLYDQLGSHPTLLHSSIWHPLERNTGYQNVSVLSSHLQMCLPLINHKHGIPLSLHAFWRIYTDLNIYEQKPTLIWRHKVIGPDFFNLFFIGCTAGQLHCRYIALVYTWSSVHFIATHCIDYQFKKGHVRSVKCYCACVYPPVYVFSFYSCRLLFQSPAMLCTHRF